MTLSAWFAFRYKGFRDEITTAGNAAHLKGWTIGVITKLYETLGPKSRRTPVALFITSADLRERETQHQDKNHPSRNPN